MILFFLLQVFNSNNIDQTIQNLKDKTKKLKELSNTFNHENESPFPERDAVNILLENVTICSKPNFLQMIKNDSKEIENSNCQKCLKIKAQEANFTFKAIRASVTNKVQFYHRCNDLCSHIDVIFDFFLDGKHIYQTNRTNIVDVKYKILFNETVKFDKMSIHAKSNTKTIICLDEFDTLYR